MELEQQMASWYTWNRTAAIVREMAHKCLWFDWILSVIEYFSTFLWKNCSLQKFFKRNFKNCSLFLMKFSIEIFFCEKNFHFQSIKKILITIFFFYFQVSLPNRIYFILIVRNICIQSKNWWCTVSLMKTFEWKLSKCAHNSVRIPYSIFRLDRLWFSYMYYSLSTTVRQCWPSTIWLLLIRFSVHMSLKSFFKPYTQPTKTALSKWRVRH